MSENRLSAFPRMIHTLLERIRSDGCSTSIRGTKMKILEKTLFAGFGGQGILAIGKIFADACAERDLNVSWLPSYGPEMRGGTCMCMVAVSDERVLSPYFVRPGSAVIMNQASLEKYLPVLDTAKVLVINTSLAHLTPEMEEKLKNVQIIRADATNIALELNAVKCANMVMLGAYARHSSALTLEQLKDSVTRKFASKPQMAEINQKALDQGYAII